jgi:type II secretory pathway component PulK
MRRGPRQHDDANPAGGKRRRRGMVLILVMIVVVMVSLAGMSFVALMSTENKAVHLRGEELQAECLLGSGEESVKTLLEMTEEKRQEAGGTIDNPDRFRGILVLGDERSARRGRYSVLSPKFEDGRVAGLRWGLENESARLNLAALPDWERRQPGAARNALLQLPGMTESTADAILDWIDADNSPREFGAEAEYYAGLELPYAPRNATPACVEELLLIKGVTRMMVFGMDRNFNYRRDADETPSKTEADDADSAPWASLVTLYSAEGNKTADGKPRIDLNQKNLETLHRQLAGVLNDEQRRFVILYRQFGPSNGEAEASEPGKPEPALDFARPGKTNLVSALDLVGTRVVVPEQGNQKRVVVESPFTDEPAAINDYLPKLLDRTTVAPGSVIRGRVNVDLAPREVLLGVPGMDEATVARIVGSRASQGSSNAEAGQRHAAWLLTEGLVDLDRMKSLMPYLTTGGDAYRAQVVGFFDRSGPIVRAEMVVDATRRPARRVYWKDLRLLGSGHSRKVLGGESSQEEKESAEEEE